MKIQKALFITLFLLIGCVTVLFAEQHRDPPKKGEQQKTPSKERIVELTGRLTSISSREIVIKDDGRHIVCTVTPETEFNGCRGIRDLREDDTVTVILGRNDRAIQVTLHSSQKVPPKKGEPQKASPKKRIVEITGRITSVSSREIVIKDDGRHIVCTITPETEFTGCRGIRDLREDDRVTVTVGRNDRAIHVSLHRPKKAPPKR